MERRRYADRRGYLIEAVRRRRKRIRLMAIDLMGGKCSRCGYQKCQEALEFHHFDSAQKDFGISERGYTRSWKKVREELKKCILVCANCHRELHASMQLSVERRTETAGEFREACPERAKRVEGPNPIASRSAW